MNQYDIGMQSDFNNMTKELGREILVYPRDFSLSHEGQEDEDSILETGVKEIAFVQELDSTHEVVASGQMNVGDLRIEFITSTVAQEESTVVTDGNEYKLLKFTKVRGMNNNSIVRVFGFGKKIPRR